MEYDNSRISHPAAGYTIAAVIAITLNTVLTIAKESYPPLLVFMKSIAHHWTVHGIVILVIFFILGTLLSRRSRRVGGMMLAILLFISTAISSLALFFFFLTE